MAKESQNKNKKAKTTTKKTTKPAAKTTTKATNKTQTKKTTKKVATPVKKVVAKKPVEVKKVEVVEETVKVEKVEVKNNKKGLLNTIWWILGFVLPPVGLILFLVWKNDKKDDAKSAGVGALIATCIWAFLGLSLLLSEGESKGNKNNSGDNTYKTVDITECSDEVADWYTDIVNKKTVITVIASTTCPYCQQYKPVIKEYAKDNDLKLYFFETDKASDADYNAITSTFNLENYEGYIPYTFVVQDGKFLGDVTGGMEKSDIIKFLSSVGL